MSVLPVRPSKATRLLITLIERDGCACFYCEHQLLDPRRERFLLSPWWPTVDHLLPRSLGGPDAQTNLVLACKQCNGRKGHHVLLLAQTIRRLRIQREADRSKLDRAHAFIDQLQWELFDAGLGEIPGRTVLATGKRKRHWSRPRPRTWDIAFLTEVSERVCANLRAENVGGDHARLSAVVKRFRPLQKRLDRALQADQPSTKGHDPRFSPPGTATLAEEITA